MMVYIISTNVIFLYSMLLSHCWHSLVLIVTFFHLLVSIMTLCKVSINLSTVWPRVFVILWKSTRGVINWFLYFLLLRSRFRKKYTLFFLSLTMGFFILWKVPKYNQIAPNISRYLWYFPNYLCLYVHESFIISHTTLFSLILWMQHMPRIHICPLYL